MSFFDNIIQWLSNAANYFAQARQVALGWVYPFNLLATPMYYLQDTFANLWSAFISFKNLLVDWGSKISKILDITTITSYFQTWINYATSAYNWVVNWFTSVWNTITQYWNSIWAWLQPWIDQRIRDLATVSEAFKNTVLSWIADVRSWTTIQLNSLQATFSTLISSVQSWTSTQINNFKSAILATISDLSIWTSTEINTIRNLLANLLDWNTLTSWISNWWKQRLLDVQSLFNSWALQLTPLLAGWQEIRDTVFEFFNDPLEWLWTKFTDWFLGAE